MIASTLALTPSAAVAISATVSFGSAGTISGVETGTVDVDVVLSTGGLFLVGAVTVPITVGGTATQGTDFTVPSPSQVVFPAGSGDGATVQYQVTIIGDFVDEPNETVSLGFGTPTGAFDSVMASGQTTHVVTITDDDTRGVSVTPQSVSVTEGDPGKIYSVSLDSRPTAAVTITPSWDPAKVTVSPSSVTIQPADWETAEDFTVTAVDDNLVENPHPGDTITHTVSGGDYNGQGAANVTVSITDNDAYEVSIASNSGSETDGASAISFTVSVSPQSPVPIDVDYTTAVGGSNPATAADFDVTSGQVMIPANTASTTIDVDITGDDLDEGPNTIPGGETFLVNLDSVSSGTIVTGQATGTIIDDDFSPVANADAYGVVKGLSITRNAANGVIRNPIGTDSDGDNMLISLTATLAVGPSHTVDGLFTLNPDGSFTYNHDGSDAPVDSFSYFLTDPAGNTSDTATVTVTIDPNQAPTVTAGVDRSGPEGSEIAVDATFTDEDGDLHIAQINWGDGETSGGVVDEGTKTVTGSHTYADDGIYTVRITLSDGFNVAFDELEVTVTNVAPTHTVDGPSFTTAEGSEITFTTTPIDPGVEDVFTYSWDVLRNGVVYDTWVDPLHEPSSTFSFTPDDDAVFGNPITWWVRVRVDDGDGAAPRRAKKVTVTNVDPSVGLLADGNPISGVAALGDEGTKVTFSLDIDDPSVDTFTYDWEVLRLGQVVATGSGPKLAFTPQDNGTFIVAVDVDDDDNPGDTSTGTAAVFATFSNVAPSFRELRSNLSPPVGGTTFLRAFIDDPGGNDTHTMTVDWGDGTQNQAGTAPPIQINHQYASPGTVPAEVCLIDDDGGTTCEDLVFNVGGRLSLGSDFNGDGRDDAAIGAPFESKGGGVAVFYSANSGPSTSNNELLIQGKDGLPDSDENGDEFGFDVDFGDIDDDGYDDLVIGQPGETVGGRQKAGAITIVPGSAAGLDLSAAVVLHEDTAGVPGSVQAFDRFGHAVAVGDFNGDAFADIAVGSPGENLAGKQAAGKATIFFGSESGITTNGAQVVDLDAPGVAGVIVKGDRLGTSLAAGDFGGDGEYDLAIGAPNKTISGKAEAGAVSVLKGSALGLIGDGSQIWTQRKNALGETPEAGDRFGLELATADFNGDGRDDLAIAAPDERVNGTFKAGAVWVLDGSWPLLTGVGAKQFTEDSLGIQGSTGARDRFGSALAGADVDNDGYAELAIGVPYDDIGGKNNAGVVILLDGTAGGATGIGSERWHEDSPGIGGIGVAGDRFGIALVMINATADKKWDLLVGIPFQNTSGQQDSGAALFLKGGGSGLTNVGDRVLHQDVTGVADTPDKGDWFGFGL